MASNSLIRSMLSNMRFPAMQISSQAIVLKSKSNCRHLFSISETISYRGRWWTFISIALIFLTSAVARSEDVNAWYIGDKPSNTTSNTRGDVKAHFNNTDGYVSPDHRYIATVKQEGSKTILTVFNVPKNSQRRHLTQEPRVKGTKLDNHVDGYMWLPGQLHSLVYGVSGPGLPRLAIWHGGKHVRTLVPRTYRKAKHVFEGFQMLGASNDGHTIYYTHYFTNEEDGDYAEDFSLRLVPG